MIKMIALDIDGTLYSTQETVLPLTKAALLKAHSQGIILVLVSGRSIHGLRSLAIAHGIPLEHTVLIGNNGGIAMDATTQKILFEHNIPKSLAQEIIRKAKHYAVNVMIPFKSELWVEDPNAPHVRYEAQTEHLTIQVLTDLSNIDFEPGKIMITVENNELDSYLNLIEAPYINQANFTKSDPYYINICAMNLNKGIALQQIGELLGISADEMIAFGDNYNDLEMITYAGIGVAMGNAVDDLKKVANAVTGSNNDEGIALFLKEYLD
jgi:Cof subfamily protein (haloacid dehalogenase superfamily)